MRLAGDTKKLAGTGIINVIDKHCECIEQLVKKWETCPHVCIFACLMFDYIQCDVITNFFKLI